MFVSYYAEPLAEERSRSPHYQWLKMIFRHHNIFAAAATAPHTYGYLPYPPLKKAVIGLRRIVVTDRPGFTPGHVIRRHRQSSTRIPDIIGCRARVPPRLPAAIKPFTLLFTYTPNKGQLAPLRRH
jgi:hypothetical protein